MLAFWRHNAFPELYRLSCDSAPAIRPVTITPEILGDARTMAPRLRDGGLRRIR